MGRNRRRRGIGSGLLGAAPLVYLLRDEFTTDDSAPVASPRTAEPGPGTLTFTQTDGEMSISGGVLAFPAQASPAFGDQRFHAASIGRAAGRAFLTRINISSGNNVALEFANSGANWATLAEIQDGLSLYFTTSSTLSLLTSGGVNNGNIGIWATSTDYDVAIVLRDTGAFIFIKGGAYTNWTLLFVVLNGTTSSNMSPAFWNSAAAGTLEYFRARDVGGVFASDYIIATVRDTSVVSGDLFTGTADGIHDFEITLEADPDAADEVSLNFRRQDANNKIRAILKRNAGDTNWDFQVRVVTAGTPATPSGWTDVTSVGTPNAIRVIADGTTLTFFTRTTATWTKRGATLTNSSFQAEAGLEIEAATGTTLTAVSSYPRTSTAYDVLGLV